ncbi:PH-like domain-containing protein [Agromyces atrinae]|uniref:PH domain-containing protein n=1 Tax=Agromyces atrinae TaxID=592376 RepID=A0A4Q2M5R4_9MICO|nr:hypothetical protein [Agromyces atrinae]NYD66277.1 hypothetical protein [Agromyces atrinae]RXZ86607.1 hypothetical protein ESP50_09435 [Agromyces atrinae]
MDKVLPTVITVVVVALAVTLMILSWRARRRRDSGLSAYELPATAGDEILAADVFYVATTPHEVPHERLAVRGLAFRASARLAVTADGLRLEIPGESETFIPTSAITGADRATWAIDRGVEPHGLVVVTWTADGDDAHPSVDSYFRARYLDDTSKIIDALRSLIAGRTGSIIEREA